MSVDARHYHFIAQENDSERLTNSEIGGRCGELSLPRHRGSFSLAVRRHRESETANVSEAHLVGGAHRRGKGRAGGHHVIEKQEVA